MGFIDHVDKLRAVVAQVFIQETGSTDLAMVKQFMVDNGFNNTKKNDYKNPELGIILEDLHEGNVLTRNGVLYFIDTVFYLTPDGKEKGRKINEQYFMVMHICSETGGMKRPKFKNKKEAEQFAEQVGGEVTPL